MFPAFNNASSTLVVITSGTTGSAIVIMNPPSVTVTAPSSFEFASRLSAKRFAVTFAAVSATASPLVRSAASVDGMLAAAATPIVPVAVIVNGATIFSNARASLASCVSVIVMGVPVSVSAIDTMSFADVSVSSPSRFAATFAALSISVCGAILGLD
jgi:hypothetical protein